MLAFELDQLFVFFKFAVANCAQVLLILLLQFVVSFVGNFFQSFYFFFLQSLISLAMPLCVSLKQSKEVCQRRKHVSWTSRRAWQHSSDNISIGISRFKNNHPRAKWIMSFFLHRRRPQAEKIIQISKQVELFSIVVMSMMVRVLVFFRLPILADIQMFLHQAHGKHWIAWRTLLFSMFAHLRVCVKFFESLLVAAEMTRNCLGYALFLFLFLD